MIVPSAALLAKSLKRNSESLETDINHTPNATVSLPHHQISSSVSNDIPTRTSNAFASLLALKRARTLHGSQALAPRQFYNLFPPISDSSSITPRTPPISLNDGDHDNYQLLTLSPPNPISHSSSRHVDLNQLECGREIARLAIAKERRERDSLRPSFQIQKDRAIDKRRSNALVHFARSSINRPGSSLVPRQNVAGRKAFEASDLKSTPNLVSAHRDALKNWARRKAVQDGKRADDKELDSELAHMLASMKASGGASSKPERTNGMLSNYENEIVSLPKFSSVLDSIEQAERIRQDERKRANGHADF
uniref:Uncharacterized protein n=1 Tax=Timspurckia oligopyrenoides TaxID=708627 RepID=A0A7S1EV22_9RHOD|mmetsp:Transcript_9991/g.17994  ORF Transcript_9991/g.17994 Transcript_9991/m.17994 type:complete len:308 (+) Transcript_9991:144-1067(+)